MIIDGDQHPIGHSIDNPSARTSNVIQNIEAVAVEIHSVTDAVMSAASDEEW